MKLALDWLLAEAFRSRTLRWTLLAGLGSAALGACTLENSVDDDPLRDVPANAFAEQPSERSLELWEEPGENLLAALAEVEAADGSTVLAPFNRVLGTLRNEVGLYFTALSSFQPFGNSFATETEECENSELPDAIEALCVSIQGRMPDPDEPEDDGRVPLVLINDLPHAASQRVLMRKLIGCAREAGFGYLALDALAEDAAALTARGYVSRSESGPLMRDPQLARLVHEAVELGYEIVSYDVPERCSTCGYLEAINQHSEDLARNLAGRTFDVDADAKVLVLAGPRQAHKRMWGPEEPYTTSLGSHLWEQTGYEPYSIEQVAINLPAPPFGASSPQPASGMYLASGPENGQCMGSYTPPSPTGLGTLDAVVVHVPPRNDEQRWDWLHAPTAERRSVTATCAACEAGSRVLIQAFPAGVDVTDRVAVDQAVCAVGGSCQMVLPAGQYRVVVWSEDARLGESEVDLTNDVSASVVL